MEGIDRSGWQDSTSEILEKNISQFPIHDLFKLFSLFHSIRHESNNNCAKLKDRRTVSSRIRRDWLGLWQESSSVVRGAQSLWQNPSETHPETPKTPFRYVYMSTCHCPCQGHKKHQKKIYMCMSIVNVYVDESVKLWIFNNILPLQIWCQSKEHRSDKLFHMLISSLHLSRHAVS